LSNASNFSNLESRIEATHRQKWITSHPDRIPCTDSTSCVRNSKASHINQTSHLSILLVAKRQVFTKPTVQFLLCFLKSNPLFQMTEYEKVSTLTNRYFSWLRLSISRLTHLRIPTYLTVTVPLPKFLKPVLVATPGQQLSYA